MTPQPHAGEALKVVWITGLFATKSHAVPDGIGHGAAKSIFGAMCGVWVYGSPSRKGDAKCKRCLKALRKNRKPQ